MPDSAAEPKPKADVDHSATDALHRAVPFAEALGVQVVTHRPQECRCRLNWADRLCAADAGLHGGAIMGLVDVIAGVCAFANIAEGATGITTIEGKTNLLRSVRAGAVDAVSRPLHVGRSVVVVETDVLDADGHLVARATHSQLVLH